MISKMLEIPCLDFKSCKIPLSVFNLAS
jgi:hypothetical protein